MPPKNIYKIQWMHTDIKTWSTETQEQKCYHYDFILDLDLTYLPKWCWRMPKFINGQVIIKHKTPINKGPENFKI